MAYRQAVSPAPLFAGLCPYLVHQVLERLVGLGADHAVAAGNEGGHAGDPIVAGLCPISVDHLLEAALFEDLARLVDRQTHRRGDLEQHIGVADILTVDEIGPVERIVDRLAARLGLRPRAQFLGSRLL